MSDQSVKSASGSIREVWVLQQRVMHYRIPVWDALVEMAAGRFELKVFGELDGGRPFGGGERRRQLMPNPLYGGITTRALLKETDLIITKRLPNVFKPIANTVYTGFTMRRADRFIISCTLPLMRRARERIIRCLA